jgi:hypothetical protein
MKVMMSHTKVKPDQREAIKAAGMRVLEGLKREQPQGIRYATFQLPDGESFVTLVAIDDGIENPLHALPEYQAFAEGFKSWIAEPPTSEQLTVGWSYRFFE